MNVRVFLENVQSYIERNTRNAQNEVFVVIIYLENKIMLLY